MRNDLFRKGLVFGIIILFVGASFVPSINGDNPSFGNAIYVDNDSECPGDGTQEWPYCKIQYAIDNASDGDTIHVFNGTYYENVVVNKSLDLIGEDRDTTIINGGGIGNVVYISADWVDISKFTIQNSDSTYYISAGIGIDSSYNTITGNNISNNNWNGIYIVDSSNYNTITGNNISSNERDGIWIEDSSNYNTITGNNISSNITCILIFYSSNNNTITGNDISNSQSGIFTWLDSSYNTITGNNISSNNYGIALSESSYYTTITGNNISDSNYGISIDISCSKNILYLNNFIENSINAWDAGTNQWDNGSIGNYWDDYEGLDEDGDGIGDTSYYIPPYVTGNKDRYPIMGETEPDTIPPEVEINKPKKGYLYLFDHELWPTSSGETKIYGIGGIDIEVYAFDNESDVHRVEFYIDDVLEEPEFNDGGEITYIWRWDETMFGEEHTIKAVAYDVACNNATAELTVTVFNLHLWSPP